MDIYGEKEVQWERQLIEELHKTILQFIENNFPYNSSANTYRVSWSVLIAALGNETSRIVQLAMRYGTKPEIIQAFQEIYELIFQTCDQEANKLKSEHR